MPIHNGHNGDGRDGRGRFAPGNGGGPGRPPNRRIHELRKALTEAVSVDDIRDIIGGLVKAAKGGDTQAAKLVLDRVFGPAQPLDLLDRLAELERKLGNTEARR